MDRRHAIKLGLTAAPMAGLIGQNSLEPASNHLAKYKHSICRWCYSKYDIHTLIAICKEYEISSIELLDRNEYLEVLKHDIHCAVVNGSKLGIPKGFNDPENHERLQADFEKLIPEVADAGLDTLICFSGNRNGMSDEEGLENCAIGLAPVLKLAQKHNIRIVMELLNSKVDHKDYMCDHTEWGVALVDKIGENNFKLLYDIYHMQIMEGDVVRTIQNYSEYIGHYHTGGVPGRNEINDTQELFYPFIMKAIAETGYDGYIGQEFIPTHDNPFVSLKKAIEICTI